MSFPNAQQLKVCFQINDKNIYNFLGNINERVIVDIAKHIEKLLKKNCASPAKIQNVFELFVETLQNMLNYSYGTTKLEENICNFVLDYDSENDTYTLESCNLIRYEQKYIIKTKINEITNLDNIALRKLVRNKARSRSDVHDKGAGLGFLVMSKRTKEPIEVSFTPQNDGILRYTQRLVI